MEIASLKTVSHAPHWDGSDCWYSTNVALCYCPPGRMVPSWLPIPLPFNQFLVYCGCFCPSTASLPDDKRVLKRSLSGFLKHPRRLPYEMKKSVVEISTGWCVFRRGVTPQAGHPWALDFKQCCPSVAGNQFLPRQAQHLSSHSFILSVSMLV